MARVHWREPVLFKSKVTSRVKHIKHPRANDYFIDSAESELIKSTGNRLAHTFKQKEKDEESLFGDLTASLLRKMPNQERLNLTILLIRTC